MSSENGGPAFPSHGTMGEVVQEGMTLRDYFAAKAMQGVTAANWNGCSKDLAEYAYKIADAMLAARKEHR